MDQLVKLSNPSALIISVDEVKQHVVIETDRDNDLLDMYIRAATRFAEERTNRVLQPNEYEFRTNKWLPYIVLPVVPVRAITSVMYMDAGGDEQTVPESEYYILSGTDGTQLHFIPGFDFPELFDRYPDNLIKVRFTAGANQEGASGDIQGLDVDPMDKLIVLVLTAHWYQNREPVRMGNIVNELPFSIKALIEARKIYA